MRRGVVVLAAALLLAGCTAAPHPPVLPTVSLTHPHVLLSCPDTPAEHLDVDLSAVVEVRRCTADFHEVEGVLNKVQYVERLTSDAVELLAAYAVDDESPTDGICGQPLLDPRILWLELEGGEIVTARAPVDRCGHPLARASDAYDVAQFDAILVAREVASTLDE